MLVHVGYLVLPVFGSVRNRGMSSFVLFLIITLTNLSGFRLFKRPYIDVNRADTC